MSKELTESLEDYLEAISHLQEEFKVARVKDISSRLNVKMPSVTNALKVLKSKNMIDYEKNSFITLTQEGEKAAQRIIRKHEVCKDFFLNILHLPEEEADRLACSVEHHISGKTVSKWARLTELIEDFCKKNDDFARCMNQLGTD